MTFLETVKLTTLTLLLILFTNNSYVKSNKALKYKTIYNTQNVFCLNWDYDTQSLLYCDGLSLLRYDYNEDRMYYTKDITAAPSCAVPVDSTPNLYAVAVQRRIEIWEWNGRSEDYKVLYTLFELINGDNIWDMNQLFVTIACDRKGRFYGGTGEHSPYGYGCFYRWEKGLKYPITLFCNVTDPVGIAFDYPRKKFYFIDSLTYRIDVFDYDEETGGISNEKVLFNFEHDGSYPGYYPNGIIIEQNGLLMVPAYEHYKVLFVDPVNKTIVRSIDVECAYLTSIAFGGPKLNNLFVGTSRDFETKPPCGNTDSITCLGTSGFVSGKLVLN